MTTADLPLILDPARLTHLLDSPGLLVVDLSRPENYVAGHVPGALHLEYARIIQPGTPVPGALRDTAQLAALFGELGIGPETHVVACDDEGGANACRLLWTLDVLGHDHLSLLDGGLVAWTREGYPLSRTPGAAHRTGFPDRGALRGFADIDYVLEHLADPAVQIVDARSPQEYAGIKRFSARGGHIPGAVNLNWLEAVDPARNLRMREPEALRTLVSTHGLDPEREVVCYCQTHHRSAHTYIMLRSLGFGRVKGYAGAWAEWGNSPHTPVET